jgi:putative addiction module component (TIGR02574 family)
MTTLALALEKQARKLPAAERERLAERLLAQMEEERLTAVDEAWVAEAERRFSAWKRKRRRALPADKVIADIRKDLRR